MDTSLSGVPVSLSENRAVVELRTLETMVADETGLVHGGFIFSLADHAAMLAINHPNVVLGAAETRFLKPVVVGDVVSADAVVERRDGKKIFVQVNASRGDEVVFTGVFTCFVPSSHVLHDRRPPSQETT